MNAYYANKGCVLRFFMSDQAMCERKTAGRVFHKDRKLSVAKVMVKGLRIHAEQRGFIWLS